MLLLLNEDGFHGCGDIRKIFSPANTQDVRNFCKAGATEVVRLVILCIRGV